MALYFVTMDLEPDAYPKLPVGGLARIVLEEARGLSRNLAYHRRARLEAMYRRGPRRGGPPDRGAAGLPRPVAPCPQTRSRCSCWLLETDRYHVSEEVEEVSCILVHTDLLENTAC